MQMLKDTKLGDRVKVWLGQSCKLSKDRTKFLSIEATVIGIDVPVNGEPGYDYILGWSLDQIRPACVENTMTVVVPTHDMTDDCKWVGNRLDYAYYKDCVSHEIECEILPPVIAPSTKITIETKETKWVDATLKDVKLGDKVRMYLNGNAKKTKAFSQKRTDRTTEAVVVGMDPAESKRGLPIRLGRKENDAAYATFYEGKRKASVAFDELLPDHKDYRYFAYCDYDDVCQVLQTVETTVEVVPDMNDKQLLGQKPFESEVISEFIKPEVKANDSPGTWTMMALGAATVMAGAANAMMTKANLGVRVDASEPIAEAVESVASAAVLG